MQLDRSLFPSFPACFPVPLVSHTQPSCTAVSRTVPYRTQVHTYLHATVLLVRCAYISHRRQPALRLSVCQVLALAGIVSYFPLIPHHTSPSFSRPHTSAPHPSSFFPSFRRLVRFPFPDDNAFSGEDLHRSRQFPVFVRRAPLRPTIDPSLEELRAAQAIPMPL
ncbi:hypothetical protein F4680DRAFT_156693 [Xylaria scruposa]|nr:hypothetical protein F4680DRAFT_156693 [Xylaria scruposa]